MAREIKLVPLDVDWPLEIESAVLTEKEHTTMTTKPECKLSGTDGTLIERWGLTVTPAWDPTGGTPSYPYDVLAPSERIPNRFPTLDEARAYIVQKYGGRWPEKK